MENPRTTTHNNQHLQKKRKNQEMKKHCMQQMLMGSSKELETAAFHLILLSQQSSSMSKPNLHSDHGGSDDHAAFRTMKKQDHAILQGIDDHKDANSMGTTFSSSWSAETIKSGISMADDYLEHEAATSPTQPKPRFRSLVDIYSVTRPL